MSAFELDVFTLTEGYELEPTPEGLCIRTTDSRPLPVCIPWDLLRALESQGVLQFRPRVRREPRAKGVAWRLWRRGA